MHILHEEGSLFHDIPYHISRGKQPFNLTSSGGSPLISFVKKKSSPLANLLM